MWLPSLWRRLSNSAVWWFGQTSVRAAISTMGQNTKRVCQGPPESLARRQSAHPLHGGASTETPMGDRRTSTEGEPIAKPRTYQDNTQTHRKRQRIRHDPAKGYSDHYITCTQAECGSKDQFLKRMAFRRCSVITYRRTVPNEVESMLDLVEGLKVE